MENKSYKGYTLFNDIEDDKLRNRNRAVLMANIAEFNIRQKKITPRGAGLIIGYFAEIPLKERKEVMESFSEHMRERGYATA